jgi:hypothetical protein
MHTLPRELHEPAVALQPNSTGIYLPHLRVTNRSSWPERAHQSSGRGAQRCAEMDRVGVVGLSSYRPVSWSAYRNAIAATRPRNYVFVRLGRGGAAPINGAEPIDLCGILLPVVRTALKWLLAARLPPAHSLLQLAHYACAGSSLAGSVRHLSSRIRAVTNWLPILRRSQSTRCRRWYEHCRSGVAQPGGFLRYRD